MPTQAEIQLASETIKQYGAVPAAPGQDVHRLTAARIFSVKPEDVTPEQRKYAKTVNYFAHYAQIFPGKPFP